MSEINVNQVTRAIKVEQGRRDINVRNVTREIKVHPVGRRGPEGEQGEIGATGPQGPAGSDATDKNFTYEFTNQSFVTVVHNLNKYPAVNVMDSAGSEVIGEIDYVDLNTVTLLFVGSFTGVATLN